MLGSDNNNNELQITSKDLLEQVSILYKQKKYSIAENLAKKYLEKKPADDEVRTILTKILYASGKMFDAIEHAKIIINHKPRNYNMKIFLANCYLETSKPSKAITELKEVIESDTNNVAAIKELAQAYFQNNQKQSAVKMYKKLEEFIYSNQEKTKNKIIIAQIHTEFNEFDLAIQEYKEILEIYPAEVEIKKKLVELYKRTYDYDLLIDLAMEVLEFHSSDGNDFWALKVLRDTYSQTKDYVKAIEYANLVKIHPLAEKTEAEEKIAKLLMETGQVDESINLLASLVSENPQDIHLKKALAASYIAKGDYEVAINIYKKILDEAGVDKINQIHFEISNVFSNWAYYLFEQQDNTECFKKFTQALQYDSQNPEIFYRLGLVNQSIKNFNEAISQYKNAIDLDSENPNYYYSIAECYEAIDSFYEKKKALIECAKYGPNNAKVHYKLALLYDSQRDTVSALAEIKKAIELDANFVDAKYKLALILEFQGNAEGAIEIYKEILKIDPEREEVINNLKMLKDAKA